MTKVPIHAIQDQNAKLSMALSRAALVRNSPSAMEGIVNAYKTSQIWNVLLDKNGKMASASLMSSLVIPTLATKVFSANCNMVKQFVDRVQFRWWVTDSLVI